MYSATVATRTDILWVTAQFALFALIGVVAVVSAGDLPLALRVAGMAVATGGGALGIAAISRIGPAMSPFPTPSQGAVLVTSGVYRLVRHPIYGGVVLVAVGVSVTLGSVLATALSLGLVPFFLAKSSHEERLLAKRFEGYRDYMGRTPRRLIPWVV